MGGLNCRDFGHLRIFHPPSPPLCPHHLSRTPSVHIAHSNQSKQELHKLHKLHNRCPTCPIRSPQSSQQAHTSSATDVRRQPSTVNRPTRPMWAPVSRSTNVTRTSTWTSKSGGSSLSQNLMTPTPQVALSTPSPVLVAGKHYMLIRNHVQNIPSSLLVMGANMGVDWVYANPNRGEPWQRWRLRKFTDPLNGYVINRFPHMHSV